MTSLGTYNPHICTNLVPGYTTTVSSTTPITLTSTSNNLQHCTGTVSQAVMLPPSVTLQNGFTYLFNNQSTGTASVYAAGPINGTTVAGYTFPLTTITIGNVNGTFAGGGGTFYILTTTGLQTITYTSYAAGVFTFASQGTGSALTGAVVSTSISLVTLISTGIERKFVVTDSTGGNTNGNINGWFPASVNDMVLDNNATPKYPQAPQTDGVWYGTGTKANVTSTSVAIGNGAVANGIYNTGIGGSASSTGNASVAVGYQASAQNASTAVGYQATAFGGIATSMGYQSIANGGTDCTAYGFAAQAVGNRSCAIGRGTIASGDSSFGAGNGCQATAQLTVAIGHTAQSFADSAIAIGADSRGNVASSVNIGPNAISAGAGYALSFGLNSSSVTPGSLGMTINSAVKQQELYSSIYNTTATSTTPLQLSSTGAHYQYLTGTVAQNVLLPAVNNPALNNGFNFTISNKSTQTATVYAPGPINGLTTAGYTFPVTTITINNVVGTFPAGPSTFFILTTTGLQTIPYTSYNSGTGVFTFASAGTGTVGFQAVVSTDMSTVLTAATLTEYYVTCNDNAGGNTNGNVNGWYVSPILTGPLVGDANGPISNNTVTRLQGNIPIAYAGSNRGFSIGLLNSLGGNTTGLCLGIACSETVGGIAIGNVNNANSTSTCIGEGNTAGTRGVSLGYGNNASGAGYNVAIGNSNNAGSASTSTAIGYSNTISATGNGIVSIGFNNTIGASGTNAILVGQSSTANGSNSIVLGPSNSVTASNGIAIGTGLSVTGANSVAIGNTLTNSVANTVVFAPSGEVFRTLAPTVGNYSYKLYKHTSGDSATITAASATGTVVTYTAVNTFVAGQTVTISGVALATVSSLGSQVLPVATFNTNSSTLTAGFNPAGGSFNVISTNGLQVVTYTGLSGSSFTGCTGGTGTVATLTTCTATTNQFNLTSVAIASATQTNFTVSSSITGVYTSGGTAVTVASASITLTADLALGGYYEASFAGSVTITMDTGANLDASAQLAGNLYVGQTFTCVVVASNNSGRITFAGATGTTLKGTLTTLKTVKLLFYRTGTASWDVTIVGDANPVLDNNAIPTYPTSPQTEGIWYGTSAKTQASTAASMIVVGNNAINRNLVTINTILIGHNSIAEAASGNPNSNNSVILGNSATSNTSNSVLIGNSCSAAGGLFNGAVCIGQGAVGIERGVTIGYLASCSSPYSVCIGSQCTAVIRSVAVGSNDFINGSVTFSNGDASVAVGSGAQTAADGMISIGWKSGVGNTVFNAVQIGRFANAIDTAHSLAFGLNSSTFQPGSLGLSIKAATLSDATNSAYQLPLYSHLYNTTTTANTVTTLTSTSAKQQYFTGSSNQGVVLPVTTTLNNAGNTLGGGFIFEIINRSTGTVTVGSTVLTTLNTAVTLPAATITVASVTSALFPSSGVLYLTTSANGLQFVAYTGKTTVTTDSTASPQTLPPVAGLFNVTSSAGLLAAGSVLVQTVSNGLQIVNYTSIVGNQLQGCTGGVGTTTASGSVTQSTFTGCTGGTGSAVVNSNVGVAVAIVEPQFRANLNLIDQSGATGVAGWYAEVFTLGQALYGLNSLAIGKGAASSTTVAANEITLGNSAVTAVRSFGAWTFLSDARDKKDIKPIEAGMDFVSKLQPVNFTWDMRDGGKRDQADCGFIAQQLQQVQQDTNTVIPGLVYDANPEQLQIAPTKLLPVIIKALQEANDEIKELKRLIDELRSR